ncbi:MAG: TetR family transcriptional regulator [Steroidobacteraceae bacterium]
MHRPRTRLRQGAASSAAARLDAPPGRGARGAGHAESRQVQKSRATRQAIIDTTIRCLMKYGVQGTSYIRIATEAGLSRGAMRYHFPARRDIMGATIEHLHHRRLAAFRRAATASPARQDRAAASLAALWRHVTHPVFIVFIDLALAARRDRELAAILRPVQRTFRRECYAVALELFPEWRPRRAQLRTAMDVSLYTMEGMVLDNLATNDRNARQLLAFLDHELRMLRGDARRGGARRSA